MRIFRMKEDEMAQRFFALVIHDRPAPFESLKTALKGLNVEISSVNSLEAAKRLIPQNEPDLIFTDTNLPDGSWPDVIKLADKCLTPTNVIVVSPYKDVKLYLSALDRGAYDFLLPPFEQKTLDFVVACAGGDARDRRHARAQIAVA
jgi:DNA-binding NtrC family response regulator